ncbi:MAG: polyprenyl synthetase family protein [Cryomorphaceae bacterium]|nr:MAG: polyprenyl synthetase family protein [Cryomorphaceae bacterium]
MKDIKHIKEPIQKELGEFEQRFRASLKTDVPLLNNVIHYIVKRKGKQIRPMFVFLTARLFGETNDSTYRAAALIELLHTATLVHDDVVDDSNLRRGFFSLNALWKNKIAVLVGDYLLSRGLQLATQHKEFALLQVVSEAVQKMSEGELLQMEKARKMDIDEATYFRIIDYKTATLIAACCQAGAISAKASNEQTEQLRQFGSAVGIAFQIKDDLFDYGDGSGIGKPTGIDIKERKITLPLIHAISTAPKKDRRWLVKTVRHHHQNPEKVKEVVNYVQQTDGIKRAVEAMHRYKDQALEILHTFEPSPARSALESLVAFSIERKQ